MSFADALGHPEQKNPLKVEVHEDNTVTFDGLTVPASDEPDLTPIYEAIGLNPDDNGLRILGSLKFSAWQQSKRLENGDRDLIWLRSYRGTLVPAQGAMTGAEFQAILDHTPPPVPDLEENPDYIRVTIVGDLQAGKTAYGRGSEALAKRVNVMNERLRKVYEDEPADTLVYLDPGDAVEGFNSTPAQKFTNDLSLPAQLEFSRRALSSLLLNSRPYFKRTVVATCTSNHSAWRDGPNYLGNPGDDFGIDIHRAVQEAFSLAELPYEWVMPDPHKEYTSLDVEGVRIALTHGHRAKSEQRMMEWWKGQVFADPDVLAGTMLFVNGHWHHPYASVVGPGQWRIQSYSLDGGSPWFTNRTGESSYPGAVTMRIDKTTKEIRDLSFIEVPCDPA